MANPDRLTALDATFLHLERANGVTMHVASVMIFEGEIPSYDEFLEAIESRLDVVPRYRQRLATVPLNQGRPVWVDDPHFNARYHVRHTALPRPGSEQQLKNLAGRVFSQQLDRERPLWEIWLVDKLEGDRFALLAKTHHALVDGISGVDITTVLFDAAPDAPPPAPPERPWVARPLPSDAQLLGEALVERATLPTEIVRGARAVLRGPRRVRAPRGRRRRRRGGAGLRRHQPRPEYPAERVDLAPPALRLGRGRARALQGDQERPRRHDQRRRAQRRLARARPLAARPRLPDRRAHAQGHGAGLGARRHRARRPRQQGRRDVGLAAGVERGPGRDLRAGARRDGRAQGVRPGRGRDRAHRPLGLRAADDHVPGRAAAVAPALHQPRGHQRARTAVPALPARAAHGGDRADGPAGREPGSGHRDHELRRQAVLRPQRRLRGHGRHRLPGLRPARGDRDAGRSRGPAVRGGRGGAPRGAAPEPTPALEPAPDEPPMAFSMPRSRPGTRSPRRDAGRARRST